MGKILTGNRGADSMDCVGLVDEGKVATEAVCTNANPFICELSKGKNDEILYGASTQSLAS